MVITHGNYHQGNNTVVDVMLPLFTASSRCFASCPVVLTVGRPIRVILPIWYDSMNCRNGIGKFCGMG